VTSFALPFCDEEPKCRGRKTSKGVLFNQKLEGGKEGGRKGEKETGRIRGTCVSEVEIEERVVVIAAAAAYAIAAAEKEEGRELGEGVVGTKIASSNEGVP